MLWRDYSFDVYGKPLIILSSLLYQQNGITFTGRGEQFLPCNDLKTWSTKSDTFSSRGGIFVLFPWVWALFLVGHQGTVKSTPRSPGTQGFKQLLASTSFFLGCLLQEAPCQRPGQAEAAPTRTLLLCLQMRVLDSNMPAIKVETAWKGIQRPPLNRLDDAAKKAEQLCLAGAARICRKNKWLLFESLSL